MPLVQAKCTNCGASLEVDNARDAAICPYCQTPYVVEKAINNYITTNNITNSTVYIVNGSHAEEENLKRQLGNVKLFIDNGNHDDAIRIIRELLDNYPGDEGVMETMLWSVDKIDEAKDIRSAISLCDTILSKLPKNYEFRERRLVFAYRNILNQKGFVAKKLESISLKNNNDETIRKEINGLLELQKVALDNCPSERFEKLKEIEEKFYRLIKESVQDGDFRILVTMYFAPKEFCKLHSLMKELYEEATEIANNLWKMKIYYGFEDEQIFESYKNYGIIKCDYGPSFEGFAKRRIECSNPLIWGRECIVVVRDNCTGGGKYILCDNKMEFLAIDDESFYSKASERVEHRILGSIRCPICGRMLKIKNNIFSSKTYKDKYCEKCGLKIKDGRIIIPNV